MSDTASVMASALGHLKLDLDHCFTTIQDKVFHYTVAEKEFAAQVVLTTTFDRLRRVCAAHEPAASPSWTTHSPSRSASTASDVLLSAHQIKSIAHSIATHALTTANGDNADEFRCAVPHCVAPGVLVEERWPIYPALRALLPSIVTGSDPSKDVAALEHELLTMIDKDMEFARASHDRHLNTSAAAAAKARARSPGGGKSRPQEQRLVSEPTGRMSAAPVHAHARNQVPRASGARSPVAENSGSIILDADLAHPREEGSDAESDDGNEATALGFQNTTLHKEKLVVLVGYNHQDGAELWAWNDDVKERAICGGDVAIDYAPEWSEVEAEIGALHAQLRKRTEGLWAAQLATLVWKLLVVGGRRRAQICGEAGKVIGSGGADGRIPRDVALEIAEMALSSPKETCEILDFQRNTVVCSPVQVTLIDLTRAMLGDPDSYFQVTAVALGDTIQDVLGKYMRTERAFPAGRHHFIRLPLALDNGQWRLTLASAGETALCKAAEMRQRQVSPVKKSASPVKKHASPTKKRQTSPVKKAGRG